MKIRELSISNCLSFGELGLLGGREDDPLALKDFNLFIGPNNAGKSNALKLLRFVDFLLTGIINVANLTNAQLPPGVGDFNNWVFNRDGSQRIRFSFRLEIERADSGCAQAIDGYDSGEHPGNTVLSLLQQKPDYPKAITFSGFVANGQISVEKLEMSAQDSRQLILDTTTKTIATLSSAGTWESKKASGNDWTLAVPRIGGELSALLRNLRNSGVPNLVNTIGAVREIEPTGDAITESLVRLRDGETKDIELYDSIVAAVKGLTFPGHEGDFRLVLREEGGGKHTLRIKVGDLQLPLEHFGSGVTQVLSMISQVAQCGANRILAIEEPEAHLHPRLQREFIAFLRKTQKDVQHQYLIATHSSVLLDSFLNAGDGVFQVDLAQAKNGGQPYSRVRPVSKEDSSDILKSLGVRPSDLFFANGILVVEGKTDKLVYSTWARMIGKAFEDRGILVIDAKGAGNIHKYLESDVIKRTCFTCLAICDKNAEKELRRQLEGIVADDQFRVLAQGDLEDYYPKEIVLDFARELGIRKRLKKKEIPTDLLPGQTVKVLNDLLGGDWWKASLAEKAANETKIEEVKREIVGYLTEIWDSIA